MKRIEQSCPKCLKCCCKFVKGLDPEDCVNKEEFGECDCQEEQHMKKRPIWIIIDNGEMFEGHQAHWADTFFSNATRLAIEYALQNDILFKGMSYEIREMTDEELKRYPGITKFTDWLFKEYGEV